MKSFSADISAFVQKAQGNMDRAVRNVGEEIAERVIDRTPVESGEARGGWRASIGGYVPVKTEHLDPTGADAMAAIRATLANVRAGDVFYVVNHEDHAIALEHGLSTQAPAGMVSVTAKEFANIVQTGAYKVQK